MQYGGTSYGEAPERLLQSNGVFNDWFFNMFAGVLQLMQQHVWVVLLYFALLAAVVALRLYADNPVKLLGCILAYVYSGIQSYALFHGNHYVFDFAADGWPLTIRTLWFAILFTGILVWGVSRALQSFAAAALATGLGAALAPLNPMRLLSKLGSSDKELDALAEGTAKNPKRQNTAIMFTDIVGYSAQMGKNEAATLAKLEVHNQIMRNQIVRNRGHVIKTIGDAFMVKYRSAESAVQCAMDCQKAIGEYNKTKSNPDDQFHIRIGIHMGEVTDTGSDAFGEGVNIAARTEPKADPDGICVTDVIVNAARNKVPAHFQSIGRLPMKNIANPPELFKVYAIEQQPAKVQKMAPVVSGAPGASGATGGTPGGVFKL